MFEQLLIKIESSPLSAVREQEDSFSDQFKPHSKEELNKRADQRSKEIASTAFKKVKKEEFSLGGTGTLDCTLCGRILSIGEVYADLPLTYIEAYSGEIELESTAIVCPQCIELLAQKLKGKTNEAFKDQFKSITPDENEDRRLKYREMGAKEMIKSSPSGRRTCHMCRRKINVGEKFVQTHFAHGYTNICPECIHELDIRLKAMDESMLEAFENQFQPYSDEELEKKGIFFPVGTKVQYKSGRYWKGTVYDHPGGEKDIVNTFVKWDNGERSGVPTHLLQRIKESVITEQEFRDIFQPADREDLVGKRGWPELNAERSEVTSIDSYEEAKKFAPGMAEHVFNGNYRQGRNFYGIRDKQSGNTYILMVSLQGKIEVLDKDGQRIEYFMESKRAS